MKTENPPGTYNRTTTLSRSTRKSLPTSRPPCFNEIAIDCTTSAIYLVFSDGSTWRYDMPAFSVALAIVTALCHGRTFNQLYRRGLGFGAPGTFAKVTGLPATVTIVYTNPPYPGTAFGPCPPAGPCSPPYPASYPCPSIVSVYNSLADNTNPYGPDVVTSPIAGAGPPAVPYYEQDIGFGTALVLRSDVTPAACAFFPWQGGFQTSGTYHNITGAPGCLAGTYALVAWSGSGVPPATITL